MTISVTGRPFRTRADQSCPHDGQVNHAITPERSGPPATSGCPQCGHRIENVAVRSVRVMPVIQATVVPSAKPPIEAPMVGLP